MSLQKMYEDALAIIKEHNSVIGINNTGYIEPDVFLNNIKASGGTSLDRLKQLSYEEIQLCMPSVKIKPISLAKDIAKIFRGKEESNLRPVSAKKADKMTLLELVQTYDPTEDNAVSKRLRSMSRGERFIVFSSGHIVDVDTTLKLLQEVKQGYEGRESILVNEEVREIHKVGDLPNNFVDENPLYKNRPLRPDGTCDQTNRSWEGISLKTRQLVRIILDLGLIDIDIEKAHNIMDIVMQDENKLMTRYPSATLEFKKLESLGKLPVLKLTLKKEAGKPNRPFDNPKKVKFIETTTWNKRLWH